MSDAAHLSRNGEDTLYKKIQLYFETLHSLERLNQSIKAKNSGEDIDWLGDDKDLREAQTILRSSIIHATSAIDENELKNAVGEKLMTAEQAEAFSKIKLQYEFEKITARNRNSEKHGQKL